jgi:hypothetical protein
MTPILDAGCSTIDEPLTLISEVIQNQASRIQNLNFVCNRLILSA